MSIDSKTFLKKCPFCGDADVTLQKFYETVDGIGEKYPQITCNKCRASITLTNNEIENIDTVCNYKGGYHSACEGLLEKYNSVLIAKWNRRTTDGNKI